MTDSTRRDVLRSVGMGVTGIVTNPITSGTDNAQAARLRARDVLIPDTEVPDRFTQYSEPKSGRFFDILTDDTPALTDADTAGNGYWAGDTQENPHWILSSMAIVAEDTIPRTPVEAAAKQSYDEYVAAYDAETGPMIDFEQLQTSSGRIAEWRVDIFQTRFGDAAKDADPLFTDLMRLQFFDNVLLGTVVFGPRAEPPELRAMLEQFATQQHALYRAHGANP